MLPIVLPYHSHTSRDSYGNGMGVVWVAGGYWGSLEFSLITLQMLGAIILSHMSLPVTSIMEEMNDPILQNTFSYS